MHLVLQDTSTHKNNRHSGTLSWCREGSPAITAARLLHRCTAFTQSADAYVTNAAQHIAASTYDAHGSLHPAAEPLAS
jgi:hypothetical protein